MKNRTLFTCVISLLAFLVACEPNPFLPDSSTPLAPVIKDLRFQNETLIFSAHLNEKDISFIHMETTHESPAVLSPNFLDPQPSYSGAFPPDSEPSRLLSWENGLFDNVSYFFREDSNALDVYCDPVRTNTLPGISDAAAPVLLGMYFESPPTRSLVRLIVEAADYDPGMTTTESFSFFCVDNWGNVGDPAVTTLDLAYINVEMTSDMIPSIRIYSSMARHLSGNRYEVLLYPDDQTQGMDKFVFNGTWTITQCGLEDLGNPRGQLNYVQSGGYYFGSTNSWVPVLNGFPLGQAGGT